MPDPSFPAVVPWRERPHLPVPTAASLIGCSRAKVYSLAQEGRLDMVKLAGRTLIMVLTGWRRGEVLGLRWSEVDLDRRTARLGDTKTGTSMRPLAMAACDIVREMPRGEYVFRARGDDAPMKGFPRIWKRVVHRVGRLSGDITPHVLRHSYASLAADLGLADATIAALLGHAGHSITRRYIHSADAALLAAADRVAEESIRLMARREGHSSEFSAQAE